MSDPSRPGLSRPGLSRFGLSPSDPQRVVAGVAAAGAVPVQMGVCVLPVTGSAESSGGEIAAAVERTVGELVGAGVVGPGTVVADLCGVDTLSAKDMNALIAARRRCRDAGAELRVVASASLRHLLTRTDAGWQGMVYPSVALAVSAGAAHVGGDFGGRTGPEPSARQDDRVVPVPVVGGPIPSGTLGFYKAVLAASPDLLSAIDLNTGSSTGSRTVWSSRLPVGVLGFTAVHERQLGHMLGADGDVLDVLAHPDDADTLRSAVAGAAALSDGQIAASRHRFLDVHGRYRWLLRRDTPLARDRDGRVVQVLSAVTDVTDVVDTETALRAAALYDPLTGLPNRVLLLDRLAAALTRHARDREPVVVMLCDLDEFKQVNDTAGHAAGDLALQSFAARLAGVVREQDTVARLHGDEFVVVLEHHQDNHRDTAGGQTLATLADTVATRILAAAAHPITIHGRIHRLTVSIGTALAQADADPAEVLARADTALYQAKAEGRNRHVIHPQP